jgi:hypothetical protein
MIEHFDVDSFPKYATQNRWSVITGIMVQTMMKHRLQGKLKAKKIEIGSKHYVVISKEEMIRWISEDFGYYAGRF